MGIIVAALKNACRYRYLIIGEIFRKPCKKLSEFTY